MVRSVGIGALVFSVFGCVWALAGLQLLNNEYMILWSIIIGAFGLVLTYFSLWHMFSGGKAETNLPYPERAEEIYRATNIIQCAAIAIAIVVLSSLNESEWIPWVISVIIGIHFIPLARIYQMNSYMAVAGCILVLNALLPAWSAHARNAYSCIGTGLILMVTATSRLVWLWKNSEYPDN